MSIGNTVGKTTGVDAHRALNTMINILQRDFYLPVTMDDATFTQLQGEWWGFEVEHLQRVAHTTLELPAADYQIQLKAVEVFQKLRGE